MSEADLFPEKKLLLGGFAGLAAAIVGAMWEDFISASVIFYALAAYEGYKFSAIPPSNVSSAPVRPLQRNPVGKFAGLGNTYKHEREVR
jgi:hypothetical protein